MSTAIVFIPAAAHSFFPGLAAAASTGVGLPVVLASTAALVMMGMAARQLSACRPEMTPELETSLQTLVAQVEKDLAHTVETIRRRAEKATLSAKGKKNLAREMDFLVKTQMPRLLDEFRRGLLTEGAVQALRDQIQSLELILVQQQAQVIEGGKRSSFLVERIQARLAAVETHAAGRLRAADLEKRLQALQAKPDDEIEARVEGLSRFLAELESFSAEFVMESVVARILGRATAGERVEKRGPDAPPTRAAAEEFDRQARRHELETELAYYGAQMAERFAAFYDEETRTMVAAVGPADGLQRLEAVRDQVKLLYQRCSSAQALSEYFREKLAEFQLAVPASDPLAEELKAAIRQPQIDRESFMPLWAKCEEFLVRHIETEKHRAMEGKVRTALQKLDYVVVSPSEEGDLARRLAESKMALVDTRHADYKVLLRFGRDEVLSVRLIRVVETPVDPATVSDFQRQKDRDVQSEWCKNADVLHENLASLGLLMVEKMRLEDHVQYVTLEQLEQQQIDVSAVRRRLESGGATSPERAEQRREKVDDPK